MDNIPFGFDDSGELKGANYIHVPTRVVLARIKRQALIDEQEREEFYLNTTQEEDNQRYFLRLRKEKKQLKENDLLRGFDIQQTIKEQREEDDNV